MENMESKLQKILEEVNKDPKKIGEIMKKSIENLGGSHPKEFNESLQLFEKIRKDFEKRGIKTIGDRIREAKISKQDQLLAKRDEVFTKNLSLMMEKELFIIYSLKKILDDQIKLDELVYPNFMKYVVSNYYRTLTELSIRICSEILLLMIGEILKNEEDGEKLKKYKKLGEDVGEDKLGLDGLKTIFSGYDRRFLKIGLSKVIDSVFLYDEKEGFSLRNKITHEKLSFIEIDFNALEREIQRVNSFNQSLMLTFYLGEFMELASQKDLEFMNKAFGRQGNPKNI